MRDPPRRAARARRGAARAGSWSAVAGSRPRPAPTASRSSQQTHWYDSWVQAPRAAAVAVLSMLGFGVVVGSLVTGSVASPLGADRSSRSRPPARPPTSSAPARPAAPVGQRLGRRRRRRRSRSRRRSAARPGSSGGERFERRGSTTTTRRTAVASHRSRRPADQARVHDHARPTRATRRRSGTATTTRTWRRRSPSRASCVHELLLRRRRLARERGRARQRPGADAQHRQQLPASTPTSSPATAGAKGQVLGRRVRVPDEPQDARRPGDGGRAAVEGVRPDQGQRQGRRSSRRAATRRSARTTAAADREATRT